MESHWRADGLTNNCKTGFSLLEPHVCSLAETSEKTTLGQDIPMDISESGQLPMTGLPPISTGTQPYAKSQASRNGAQTFDGRSLEQQDAEPFRSTSFLNERQPQILGSSSDGIKRKTSPIPAGGPVEKRARHDSGDMDVDTFSECKSHLTDMMNEVSLLSFFYLYSYAVEDASTGCWFLVSTDRINQDRRPSPRTW